MFRQLNFRNQLAALAAVPILAVAVVASGLLLFIDGPGTRPYGIFALVCLGLSGGVAYVIGRSILDSMDELTRSTNELARAHSLLADGEITADELEPVHVERDDELGEIAAAVNAITDATVAATESQRGAVKEGLSTIVVNLARRSQTLLDRQVEYLDRLESSEEDPDRLGELFKVDHLATRMRRNAESLMVLAEADPGRRRGGPVEVADVLRVAMGEVENYEHIDLTDVDDGQVGATVAVDLAHLVSELMENATQFSPPSTPVEVSGVFSGNDTFRIAVADSGMGMTQDKLAEANEILANPPELGLGMGRSLGFMVIGRLANRLGATVTLESNGNSGLRALVSIPSDLLIAGSGGAAPAEQAETIEVAEEQPAPQAPTEPLETRPTAEKPADPAPQESAPVSQNGPASSAALERLLGINTDNFGLTERREEPTEDWTTKSPFEDANTGADAADAQSDDAESWTPPEVTLGAPRKLEDAVPSGDAFESGVASLLDDSADEEASTGRALRSDAATSAGLTKRQRGSSSVPIGQGRPVAASSRDPEEVRSMLSRYREGLKGKKLDSNDSSADQGNSEPSTKNKDR